MKKIIVIILLSIAYTSATFAQIGANYADEKGKQGFWVGVDSTKKKIYEGHFVNDKPVGTFTYYYNNGSKKSEATFSPNGSQVYAKMYNIGGTFIAEGQYLNEKKDSLWRFYDAKNGKLLSTSFYRNGLKHGESKVYYPNGNVVESKMWLNGVAEGPCKKYFNNGQLRYDGNYHNNLVHGTLKFYFTNGKLYATGDYVNDLKHGDWVYNKKEGGFDHKEVYRHGKLLSEDLNLITKEQQEKERLKYLEKTERERRSGGGMEQHLDPRR